MGASSSKPETKVFTPTAPVDFSALFLAQLENTAESDYSRSQFTEKYIQERVASELKKLEASAITKFQSTLKESLAKDDKQTISVAQTNAKIDELAKVLKANQQFIKVDADSEVTSQREKVLACLKENKGKALNCWEEVEQFKKLTKNL